MAERSFAREVEKLRFGAGEEFRGEGILAVTKALLQSGVGYVGVIPGGGGWTAHPILGEMNVGYWDGSVQSMPVKDYRLRAPGGVTQQVQWVDRVNAKY